MGKEYNKKSKILWDKFLKDRDDETRNKIVELYYPILQNIARKLAAKLNYKVTAEELVSHGVDGVYKAIAGYDVSFGAKFETYAYLRVYGSMIDGLRSEDWVPRSVRVRQSDLEETRQLLENKKGKKVGQKEVLDKLKIDIDEYTLNVKKYKAIGFSSIEATNLSGSEDNKNKKDFNKYLIACNESEPDKELLRKEFFNKLIGKNFTEVEKYIIYLYYYQNSTMGEIADILEMSESRVSQIHQELLIRLKIRIDVNPSYFDRDIASIVFDQGSKELK